MISMRDMLVFPVLKILLLWLGMICVVSKRIVCLAQNWNFPLEIKPFL
jgi:hypothetical protein